MVVLAFLTDPEVVVKILRHLGLPTTAPALAPSRSSGRIMGFALGEDEDASARGPRDAAEESTLPLRSDPPCPRREDVSVRGPRRRCRRVCTRGRRATGSSPPGISHQA